MTDKTLPNLILRNYKLHPTKWLVIYLAKCVVWAAWVGLCLHAIIFMEDWVLRLIPQCLLGAAFSHGVELQHQALHNTGFQSPWANRLAGCLLGLPMLVSFSAYQDSHLFHHQALGRADDEEYFKQDGRPLGWWKFICLLFMFNHYHALCNNVAGALTSGDYPVKSRIGNVGKIRYEHLFIGGVFCGLALASAWCASAWFVQCWLIPLFFFATPIHALIELPEHYGCQNSSASVFENTRTIRANTIACWFTNGNNYHVEHHRFPRLPMEQLSEVHPHLKHNIQFLLPSYRSFYRRLLRDLIAGKAGKKT